MARPKKIGLESFPMDCVLDAKIEMLEVEFGNDGFTIWIKLLQRIYQTENGELDISHVFRRKTLVKSSNVDENRWNLIVSTMVELEIFDKTRYENDQILTSHGIKERMKKALNIRERGNERAKNSFSAKNTRKTPEKHPLNEKGNKVPIYSNNLRDINKEKSIGTKQFVKPKLEEVIAFYESLKATKDQAEFYFDSKESNGWRTGKNALKDWKADSRKWIKKGWGLDQLDKITKTAQIMTDDGRPVSGRMVL